MSTRKVVLLVLVATLLSITFLLAPSRPAPVAASEDPGIIAYVRRSTHDIHLISPDGTGDRVLWTAPQPLGLLPTHDLAWRPDGRELAFSSEHEETCSWYQSDVYAIGYTGSGYRRVTNAPACAVLASLPKGSVTVDVSNYTVGQVQVYVQGAPGITLALHSGLVTFENVADLGPGVLQPAVGIDGEYRTLTNPPLADVQPGATVSAGELIITASSGIDAFGPGKVSWKADGSALAYGIRTYSRISHIDANPPYGSIGEPLPVVEHAAPNLVAWVRLPRPRISISIPRRTIRSLRTSRGFTSTPWATHRVAQSWCQSAPTTMPRWCTTSNGCPTRPDSSSPSSTLTMSSTPTSSSTTSRRKRSRS